MTTTVSGVMLEQAVPNGDVLAVATVTEQMGSWKYQKAYRKSWYTVRYSPRQKKHFFSFLDHSGKFAQGPRIGYSSAPAGSLHNRPVPAAVLQAMSLLQGGN